MLLSQGFYVLLVGLDGQGTTKESKFNLADGGLGSVFSHQEIHCNIIASYVWQISQEVF